MDRKKEVFWFSVYVKGFFYRPQKQNGEKEQWIKVCFIFFHEAMPLWQSELGLVKDSTCCIEISDLSKLIIKQTYIISFNTFSLTNCFVVQFVFLPGSFFISRANTLVSIPRTDFWKAKCCWVSSSVIDFQLTENGAPVTWELNAWCGVHPVYC